MCGRFALATEKHVLEMLFRLDIQEDLYPRYNIAPGQDVAIVRAAPAENRKEIAFLKWGLVPFWASDQSIGSRMINARSETVTEKPSFREAFKKRRLLIPATGFFEWRKEDGQKQPYYICRKDQAPFAFAGLWENWQKGLEPLNTCTIMTTEPNALLSEIHNRMPVIIEQQQYDLWLDPQANRSELLDLLKPAMASELMLFPVSTRVNNPANEAADLIEPL